VTGSGIAVMVNVGAAEVTVLIGIVGIGSRGVEVAIADCVIVSTNSDERSIESAAWVVGNACCGEGTHEPANREDAIAIVAIPFIKDSYSCI
jgi:hypothetical protein